MHAVFAVIVILVAAGVLARTISRAREVHRGYAAPGRTGMRAGPASMPRFQSGPAPRGRQASRSRGLGILDHRRAVAMEKLRHRHAVVRDEVRQRHALVRDWAKHHIRMREREAEWQRQAAVKTAPPASAQAQPGNPPGAARPAAKPETATVPGSVIREPPPGAAPAAEPPPPASPPPSSPPSQEGTPVSNPGAVEAAVDGMQRVHATASAGNIRRKQWAIKVCAEICIRASALLLMMSRTLSERGYGPEIFEPLTRAGVMTQAAAMACGESDTAITSLANMTVGDLADSPRRAPLREELSESGSGDGMKWARYTPVSTGFSRYVSESSPEGK